MTIRTKILAALAAVGIGVGTMALPSSAQLPTLQGPYFEQVCVAPLGEPGDVYEGWLSMRFEPKPGKKLKRATIGVYDQWSGEAFATKRMPKGAVKAQDGSYTMVDYETVRASDQAYPNVFRWWAYTDGVFAEYILGCINVTKGIGASSTSIGG